MARFAFQLLVVCLVGASFVSACDTTKYTKDAAECTKKQTACSKEAGTDKCKMGACVEKSNTCVFKAVGDAKCCKSMGAALDANVKSWDTQKKQYGDKCNLNTKFKCGGGGGTSSDATSTKASAAGFFATITALVLSNTM